MTTMAMMKAKLKPTPLTPCAGAAATERARMAGESPVVRRGTGKGGMRNKQKERAQHPLLISQYEKGELSW